MDDLAYINESDHAPLSDKESKRISYNKKERELYNAMSNEKRGIINSQRRAAYAKKTSLKQSNLFGLRRLAAIGTQPWHLPVTPTCKHCCAIRFYRETPGFCCSSGQVSLSLADVPEELRSLLFGSSQLSVHFRANIRTYNNAFAFTSFGVTYDKDLCRNDKNVYTFKVHGMVYHFINDLIPAEGKAKNLQLYFFDTENEVYNRLAVSDKLNEKVILMLLKLLKTNPYSAFFRNLREYSDLNEYRIVLRADPRTNQNTHNLPTVDQIAAIWKDTDEPNQSQPRDIQVYTKSGHSQRVEYYYGCYDPLQYTILFPHGEPGWHVGIKRKRPSEMTNTTERMECCEGSHSTLPLYASSASQLLHTEAKAVEKNLQKRASVSAREYYCYKLQMRSDDRSILLHTGRLLQQYLNDMYIKVETQRLDYFRKEQHQKHARMESLQGIVDSLGIQGENDASKIGQRTLLPSSFIGGPRDMHKRYMDAMSLVQKYGKPDLFLTMTCNPNWPEISENKLQHELPHDRPDLLVRVFKAKLDELKDELINKQIFGEVEAYTYVIEF